MGMFSHLLGFDYRKDSAELLPAIERAVSGVEPLLRQAGGYPGAYRKPVKTALEYARHLAASVPGPVAVNRESYAQDPFVHALFPSLDFIQDAFNASRAIRDYCSEFPDSGEIYALMGMRRWEKNLLGMELAGQVIQRDVPQNMVYFTSHTIENPAPSEEQAREQVAWSFFGSLVGKVAKRVAERKQQKQSRLQEKDLLAARLRAADAKDRPALEEELSRVVDSVQATVSSLDLRNYITDFEAVLMSPERYLWLDQTSIFMDRMGVRRDSNDTNQGEPVTFNDLIGFDRRNWTVTMVHCSNMRSESFAERLETAYRTLAIY